MDHPSIMKLLEDDEDESMHSGADVEALSAALNRDIGGDASTFSQPSDSESVGVLPQASTSASQHLLEQWQNSNQDGNIGENIQPKEEKHITHSSEQPSSQTESAHQASGTKDHDQQSNTQPKHDQQQLKQEASETNASQHLEKNKAKASDQTLFQLPKQESSSQQFESHQQNTHQQLSVEQQTAAANEENCSAKRMKASPSIPFQLLIPIIRPHLDKDRNMQLNSVFTKLRTNEVSKDNFLRVIRNIVGDQMLRQAVNQVHMQLQAQAARNQQPGPNQYSLQNQVSQQQHKSRGPHQFHDPRAFSSLNSMPSSQTQMQMDNSFPPIENIGQKSREIEKNILKSESSLPVNSSHGMNKPQQHPQRPQQTPFPIYTGSSSSFHSHPYARPPMSSATSVRPQTQESQMRPHTQGMVSTPLGSTQPGSVINVPKYELQNIANETKRFHGAVPWQTMENKEQRSAYAKQEAVDLASEPQTNPQLNNSDGTLIGSGHIGLGNPTLGSLNNEGLEKQSSRTGLSAPVSTIGSQANSADSTMQISSPPVAGTTSKTPAKKPSVGQKKPLEAVTNSPAMASKKQKTAGTFHDQSIEHLNDVTAVSGVNLQEEEEQLLSAPKEDTRASEATRRVVQEEEERLILQKGPLQKKLADIIFKNGLKKISGDVERCLSLCVEERLRGVVSSIVRLSKQRVDIEKMRHRFVITLDVHRHILEMNKKAKEEWDKKQAEEAEKLRKVNEIEGSSGSDADKDKDEGRSKANKANKEEDDKMRATAANVAARAAVGGDDMFSKWQLMAEQARQKREGLDGPSSSQTSKAITSNKPSPSLRKNSREQQETQKRGTSIFGGYRKFGRSAAPMPQSKVARNISRKDVIAVLEREPQMLKSTLIYRLYEKLSDTSAEA